MEVLRVYVQTLNSLSQVFFSLGLLLAILGFIVLGREPKQVAKCFAVYFCALFAPQLLLATAVLIFKAVTR